MVVVVANPRLEPRRRSGRLNPADETFSRQQREGIVDGLQRDGPELAAHGLGDGIGGAVRLRADRSQHGDPLRGDLYAANA